MYIQDLLMQLSDTVKHFNGNNDIHNSAKLVHQLVKSGTNGILNNYKTKQYILQ